MFSGHFEDQEQRSFEIVHFLQVDVGPGHLWKDCAQVGPRERGK